MLGLDLSRLLCLPFKIVEESLTFLKTEKVIEVLGGDLIGRISYRFTLTDIGRRRAGECMKLCAYVGPAPVPLEDYCEQVYRQAVTAINVSPEALRAAMSHLVVSDELFNGVGPAVVSGKSVFIYGPPGNGKTAMARSIGDFMNNSGGSIYVPYAIQAEGRRPLENESRVQFTSLRKMRVKVKINQPRGLPQLHAFWRTGYYAPTQ